MSSKSRREFVQLGLATIPAAGFLTIPSRLGAADAKPNSKVAGVQLGLNVPYSFGGKTMTEDEILKNCVQLGLSGVELRTQPVEAFLGAPKEKISDWRKSAPMDRAKEFRKKWNDAGVLIEIVKVDGLFKMSDEELDYAFTLAKTLGGRAISTEISHVDAELKRVGQFADKHQFMVGYHGHATTGPKDWEAAFALAKFNGANVDIGHFIAGDHGSPVPFITKYHDRVTHVHIKDRKVHNGGNTPFGEGDTPIAEVLRLIRDTKWNIQATIEFEYKVPADSNRMKELARAIQFCRAALV